MPRHTHESGAPAPSAVVAAAVGAERASADQLRSLLEVQARLGGARSAAILRIGAPGRVDAVCEWHAAGGDEPASWMALAAEIVGGEMGAGGGVVVRPCEAGWVVVVGLAAIGEADAGAAFLLDTCPEDEARDRADRLMLGVVALWAHRVASVPPRPTTGPETLHRAVEVAATILRGRTMREVGAAVVHELATALDAERVCLGIVRGGSRGWVRLEYVSGVDRVKRSMAIVPPMESAMEECADQDQEVCAPEEPGSTVIGRAHRALSEHLGNRPVASLPVRTTDTRDPMAGVVTIERSGDRPIGVDDLALVRLVLELVSARIAECRARSGWIGARFDRWARRTVGHIVGPDHALAKLAALALAAALVCGLVIQRPERIPASATIVAAEARVCAAPAEATMVSVDVRAGDRVIGGETVIGRLDDSGVRLELAEVVARARALEQAEATARGRGETAEARIAAAQREESAARIALLEDRLSRMTIIAPIDGVVVHAPDQRSIGAVVRAGDGLFEIAAEDRLRFEASAPVRWIDRIGVGGHGRLTLAGAPREIIAVEIDQAEAVIRATKDGTPTDRFLIAGSVPDSTEGVRIGMRGVVRVEVGEAPILVIWTRGIADVVRTRGWW